jgi:hypothetical protein
LIGLLIIIVLAGGGYVAGGTGAPIHACADDMDKDGLFCYLKCKPKFHGIGPVCWEDKR